MPFPTTDDLPAKCADSLPLVERDAVRIVLLDASGRLLLLHTQDLGNPQFGTAWELPGGGREGSETFVDAVIRELREETGICIDTQQIGKPRWRRDVLYTYRGTRRFQHEMIATVRLHDISPGVQSSQRVDFETEDLFESRWWTAEEIELSTERFYPRDLARLLPRCLAGENIEEPLEIWP